MQAALDIALEHLRVGDAQRIHRITLRVGALSGAVPEALAFAFDVVTKDTPAHGSRLEMQQIPVVCYCSVCAEEFEPPNVIFECPRCGQLSADVRQGRELELASLEVS